MRAAVVSDLHLGTHSGADLLRRPEVRARLFDALSDADEVVLLGDTVELRDDSLADSIERALPFFEALGRRARSAQADDRAREPRPPVRRGRG